MKPADPKRREQWRQAQRARRVYHRALGLCRACDNAAGPASTILCEIHRAAQYASHAAHKARKIATMRSAQACARETV